MSSFYRNAKFSTYGGGLQSKGIPSKSSWISMLISCNFSTAFLNELRCFLSLGVFLIIFQKIKRFVDVLYKQDLGFGVYLVKFPKLVPMCDSFFIVSTQ